MDSVNEEERICRPGGFALTDRMLRWWAEEESGRRACLDWLRETGGKRDPEPIRLADIGCGEGATLRHIRALYPDWALTGVDPAAADRGISGRLCASETAEREAVTGGKTGDPASGIQILQGYAENLPLPDHSVDILLMECSFSRFRDPEKALDEAVRVLRPAGRLLLSDMFRREPAAGTKKNVSAERTNFTDGQRNMAAVRTKPEGITCAVGRLETADEIRGRLEEHGFHLLRMKDVSKVLGDWIGQKIFDDDMDSIREALGIEPCELRRLRCGYLLCEAMPSVIPALLTYAEKKSSFYRERLAAGTQAERTSMEKAAAGGDRTAPETGTCSERRRLAALPTCDAADLRRDPYAFLCVPPKDVARIITLRSSGSEGTPKRIFFTESDLERTADFFDWGIRSLVRPGDRVGVFMAGPQHWSVGGLLKEAISRLPAETEVFGFITDYEEAARQAEGMDSLVGVPAQIYRLMKEHPELHPRTVLLSADNVPLAAAEALEQTWGCQVFTHWGMSETGYGGGVQCRCREGYHLREEDHLLEIVDPETGVPVPEGEYGEIVLTAWNRKAMPLIRYRTGDLARLLPGRCPCGSLLPRLDRVQCRIAGRMTLPDGGGMTLPEIDEILYRESIRAYRACWDEAGACLRIGILPETRLTEEERKKLREEIRRKIRSRFGGSFAIEVEENYAGEDRGKRRLTGEDTGERQ